MTFERLADMILRAPQKNNRRLIAIDGGGGAGKTTFAGYLQQAIPGSHVVRIDDFYRPPELRSPLNSTKEINPNFDWDRLNSLVLEPGKKNSDIVYQLYDFRSGVLSEETVEIPSGATIIIEGVWSMQEVFVDVYDYCIWIEAPENIRLQRGVTRDGEDFRKIWEDEWIPIDEYYKESQKPQDKADIIVDSCASNFAKNDIVLVSNNELRSKKGLDLK